MLPVVAVSVFVLLTAGVYLILQTRLLRVLIGLSLLSHGVHLILLSAGSWGTRAPIVEATARVGDMADPVPQAFVLTAIVISMAMTLYLLAGLSALARRGRAADLTPPPESDEGRDRTEVAAELEGRLP